MLSKVMEDYVTYPIVYSDSNEHILHPTFSTRFSNLEIDILSNDTGAGINDRSINTTHQRKHDHQVFGENISMKLLDPLGDEYEQSSYVDMALSVAESYSRIEERLSLSAWRDNSALSQSRYDDGGFLDDSFER